MEEERINKIQSLTSEEIEILRVVFSNPGKNALDLAGLLNYAESTFRNKMSVIFESLGVPEGVFNKKEWIVREYSEVYEYVFNREEWEKKQRQMYITPPAPIVEETPKIKVDPKQGAKKEEMVTLQKKDVITMREVIEVLLLYTLLGLMLAYIAFLIGAHIEHFNPGFLDHYLLMFAK